MGGTMSQAIGVIGMMCVVYAYLAIEKGWVDRNQRRFYLINLIGAILLTISLLFNFNLGSFMIEVFWIWISVAGLIRIKKEKQGQE